MLGALGMVGMTACACPNVNLPSNDTTEELQPTEEDLACASILEQIKEIEKDIKLQALTQAGVEVKIESKIDHCRLLNDPYADSGVLLLSADLWEDGEYKGQQGVLVKFVKVGSEWAILSMGTYYFIEPQVEEDAGAEALDQ